MTPPLHILQSKSKNEEQKKRAIADLSCINHSWRYYEQGPFNDWKWGERTDEDGNTVKDLTKQVLFAHE